MLSQLAWGYNETVFSINNKKYRVAGKYPLNMSLNTFIRDVANHKGTKYMCEEGGCGCCMVTVSAKNPASGKNKIFAVNSCLVFVLSCHGWSITTVEGIGSREQGYHPIQATLAKFNGTQCGYCSPGMVMNMYSLLAANKDRTMQEVEDSFGGNICRCTGYRPILDAFKSFCVDAPPSLRDKCMDIEDIGKFHFPLRRTASNTSLAMDQEAQYVSDVDVPVHIVGISGEWYRVHSVEEVLDIFRIIGDRTYQLISGNTAHGVYHLTEQPEVYIDVTPVAELRAVTMNADSITVGANITLADFSSFLRSSAAEIGYEYFSQMADHVDLVANVSVRNIGTVAGNLALKHQHNEFASDIFLMLEVVGAILDIEVSSDNFSNLSLTPQEFLKTDMNKKLIVQFTLYPRENYVLKTYKVMPRAQNAHAIVNAGFLFKLASAGNYEVLDKANIVYGGISSTFVHAINTETFLTGKQLNQQSTLTGALQQLEAELQPEDNPPDMSPAYRKGLAMSLFYKCVLSIIGDCAKNEYVSGGQVLSRPVSSGKQTYQTVPSNYPVGQPIIKLEALAQCSGEAEYVNDRAHFPGELHAAFVLTTVPNGKIVSIDASEALTVPGVVEFYTSQDIPGLNNVSPNPTPFTQENEELFCSGSVLYNGQPVGLIVAETRQAANRAKGLVKVSYREVTKPTIHVRDTARQKLQHRNATLPSRSMHREGNTESEANATNVVEGTFNMGFQYHYHLECQTCSVVPKEDGYEVYVSTQWMDLCQKAVAQVLGVPENRVSVQVRRMGGAFGAKLTRATFVASACGLAAHLLRKPVRMVMTMQDNMRAIGKRAETATDYRVGFDDKGKIQYMEATFYENTGSSKNDNQTFLITEGFKNCYENTDWSVIVQEVTTNTPSSALMRAPGTVEAISSVENIMEHIAKTINMDSVQVRLNNIASDNLIVSLIDNIKISSDFTARKQHIAEFNQRNRWMKKGISLVPMSFGINFLGNLHCSVSIYAGDGSVAVTHGGTECGQGINTKVAQAVSYTLGINLDLVTVMPSNNMSAANDTCTGGSITSDMACSAAIQCCKELLTRLEDTAKSLDNPSWKDLVSTASSNGVDLVASSMFASNEDGESYRVYGACILEVIIDILTGNFQIIRADIMEDAGLSLSPKIDIGQIEGAFVIGLGLWTCENIVLDDATGELLTNRSWNYWTPGAKDIPIDFLVEMRQNVPNPVGVLRSKATGEPPLCLAVSLLFALRNALESARIDAGNNESWFQITPPLTAEKIWQYTLTNHGQFLLK